MKQEQVKALLDEIRKESFVEGYVASDVECMGLLLSKYFGFNGVDILRATYYGLEDSNYHTVNETIEKLIEAEGTTL